MEIRIVLTCGGKGKGREGAFWGSEMCSVMMVVTQGLHTHIHIPRCIYMCMQMQRTHVAVYLRLIYLALYNFRKEKSWKFNFIYGILENMIKRNWSSLGKQEFFWKLLTCVHVFEFLEPKLGGVVLLVMVAQADQNRDGKKRKRFTWFLFFILFLPVCSLSVLISPNLCLPFPWHHGQGGGQCWESKRGCWMRVQGSGCVSGIYVLVGGMGNTTLTCREVSQQGGCDGTVIETSR